MIHVLYGTPPDFQSFLFDINDHYEGPGVIPDEELKPASQGMISTLLATPSRVSSRQSSRSKNSQATFRMPDLPQEEPNPNNKWIPMAELNKTHFLLNTNVVPVNVIQYLKKKLFDPPLLSSLERRWELLVPAIKTWIFDKNPEWEMTDSVIEELEKTLYSGFRSRPSSEVGTPRVSKGLVQSLRSLAQSSTPAQKPPPSGITETGPLAPGSITVIKETTPTNNVPSDLTTSVTDSGITIDFRANHTEILMSYFDKFLFDAEKAWREVGEGKIDVDLCDQRGAISGLSLLPPFPQRVTDFEIFAARELHYPILLSKSPASVVAWPEAAFARSGSSTSTAPPRGSLPSASLTTPPSKTAKSSKKSLPKRGGASAAAAGTKGEDQGPSQQQPQPLLQQQQQQQRQSLAGMVQGSFSSLPSPAIRFASGDPAMQDVTIKGFLHPLLMKLLRPEEYEEEMMVGTNVSKAVSSEMPIRPALGLHSALRVGYRRTSPSSHISLRPAVARTAHATFSATEDNNVSANAFGLPQNSGSSRLEVERVSQPAEGAEEGEAPEEPPPTGVKMLIEKAEKKLSEEIVAQMKSLLEERELDEKDREILENTRLTTGVKVLLPLNDRFTESSLAEFLETLWASCAEMRMFEEEQMILQMPIFQIPPVEEQEEQPEGDLALDA